MASFGGTVKLTGESEYRKALTQITQNLRETSSALTLVDSQYAKNDNSIATVTAKNEKLNSILEKQRSDYNNLKISFDSINKTYQEQITAHNKLQSEYDKEKNELEKLKKTQGESSNAYKEQKEKVGELATQLTKSKQNIDANETAMSKLRVQMNNAETAINKTTREIDDLGKETKNTTNDVKKAGDGFTVFKGVLSDLASKGISLAISGLKKIGGAVIDVGKQAIESYAEYEQLVGGVETLFKDSADIVKKYAEQAYKTTGLSANEYMENVTSFSASLLQGLGGDTKKAAEIADIAMIDMSDNANKMGTSMEMITNAYQGFAKGNFTMLDNLKLGFGGTKEEMARLINESGVMGDTLITTGQKGNFATVSFDKMIEAIHKVQENMGITGTTAKEASTTISGSVNQMKKSWQNLLTSIADDNKDLGKSINEFVDSAVTAAQNLVPRIKVAIEGLKKLINNIINEVFPKLKREIPELKPLIEVFEWFIKNKTLVVNAVKLIIAAFAVNKIMQFTKSMTDGAKGLLEWVKDATLATTATNANTAAVATNTATQAAAATTTGVLTKATQLLNAAWKANPIGIVITAVLALITVMNKLSEKSKELAEAEKDNLSAIQEETQKVKDNKQAWDDLTKAKQDTINVGMTELSNYRALYNELESIVDENGKVKDGYEERASFITTTLKDALGVEIDMIDGQVQGMQNLRDSIDQVIAKKKAQIILNSQEEAYSEAVNKQADAVRQLTAYENKLAEERNRKQEIDDEVTKAQEEYTKSLYLFGGALQFVKKKELENAQERKATYEQGVKDLENSITQQEQLIGEYAYNVQQYETNMALAHAEKYDEMSTVSWNYVTDYKNAIDAEKAMLEDKVTNREKTIDTLKKVRTEANAEEIDAEIAKNERLLIEEQQALDEYNAKTTSALNNAQIIWSDGLDDQLSEITGSKVEFKDAGNGQVQAYVDGVKVGEPKAKDEMAKMTTDAINEISRQKTGATSAGEDLIDGINNGIGNQRKQSGVFGTIRTFGLNLLQNLRNSLQEHSPSKATDEMGQFLIEGLIGGVKEKSKQALTQVATLGKNIISTFDASLSGDSLNTSLAAQIQSGIPSPVGVSSSISQSNYNQEYNYNNMLNAFKEALASMKIEMDDETMGKFVDKTVARTIYS